MRRGEARARRRAAPDVLPPIAARGAAKAPTRWSSSPNGRSSAAPISTRCKRQLQAAADLRRPQPVRPGVVRGAGFEISIGRRSGAPGRRRRHERADASRTRRVQLRSRTWHDRAARARVLVVGDVMLDRYWFGDVERISPEAPVPVVQDRAHRGASRRRRQRRAQRRSARRARDAAVGRSATTSRRDAAAAPARSRPRRRTSFLRDAALTTTVKLRVIGRQQQLLRIDFETAPPHELLAAQARRIRARCLPDADALVLSDYGKGGLAHIATMIERARAAGKPVLVDPKGDDWDALSRRHGASRPIAANSARSSGRWRDEAELAATRAGAAPRARPRGAARHALGGGDEPLHRRGRADDPGAGARGVRRFRRGRHGDRDARRVARRRRDAARRDVASPTRRPASSSASSAPPSPNPASSS